MSCCDNGALSRCFCFCYSAEEGSAADEAPHVLAVIKKLKCSLKNYIEPDFGLLDELLSLKVLTLPQLADVLSEKTVYRRNAALLDLLETEDQCWQFLKALQRTDQQHVFHFIEANGDVGADFGDIRPLDEARLQTLTGSFSQLVENIDANILFITQLNDVECITSPQREHLINNVHLRSRNHELLQLLTRRSVADYKKFTQVLSKQQPHLLPLLGDYGADGLNDDVIELDDGVVTRLSVPPISSHDPIQRRAEILRPVDLHKPCGKELAVIDVSDLRVHWYTPRVRDTFQSLYSFLPDSYGTVCLKRLTWPLTDDKPYFNFLSALQENQDSSRALEPPTEMSDSNARTMETTLFHLPVEMLETVLMRAFLMLYQTDRSSSSECLAVTLLTSVCWDWYYGLHGWPQSPTRHWVRHKLKKLIECSCRPFQRSPDMRHVYAHGVVGLTQLQNVVYIVSRLSWTISRFSAITHHRLTDINVENMRWPWDIVACEQTSHVYITDIPPTGAACVWRVSSDGEDVKCWLPKSPSDSFEPWTLSVASSRLLVTSLAINQLIQFDAVGNELRRVHLPDDIDPWHAVESPTGTYIVSHRNRQLNRYQVSEVNNEGEVLRQFRGSRLLPLGSTEHVAVDSQGNVFVPDRGSRRILLLNSELALRRVIIDEHQLNYKRPQRLCYTEQSGQLLVGFDRGAVAFDVLRR